jgi:hypothetical protein
MGMRLSGKRGDRVHELRDTRPRPSRDGIVGDQATEGVVRQKDDRRHVKPLAVRHHEVAVCGESLTVCEDALGRQVLDVNERAIDLAGDSVHHAARQVFAKTRALRFCLEFSIESARQLREEDAAAAPLAS